MSRRYSAPPLRLTDENVEGMQVALQKLAPYPVTREIAEESIYNLVRFFEVLQRWKEESDAKEQMAARGLVPTGSSTDQREEP